MVLEWNADDPAKLGKLRIWADDRGFLATMAFPSLGGVPKAEWFILLI